MNQRLSPTQLDELLLLQLTVAWAGEAAAGDAPRLGWWKTDLVDAMAGGDLFSRLVPRTAAWASLALVRAAATRIDEAAREKIAQGDALRTLFHLGFAIDEQIADRIAHHRTHGHTPAEVLGARWLVDKPWSKGAFEAFLHALGAPKVEVTPSGRKVIAPRATVLEAAPLLAAALLPLAPAYPLPFFEPSPDGGHA